MADNDPQLGELKDELNQALSALDHALVEADRSVALVRNNVTRVLELAEHAAEMETAILRAREQLSVAFYSEGDAPSLHAVPTQDAPESEPEAAPEQIETTQEQDDTPSAELLEGPDVQPAAEVEPEPVAEEIAEPAVEATTTAMTRCLRLKISKKSGSLDLKDVDRAINENAAVIDVALLDYDGRQATLKLWVNEKSDPNGVREALLSSLRNHLGENDTELDVSYEEEERAA